LLVTHPAPTLPDLLDAHAFVGLAVTNVHTGYNCSVEWRDREWSPHVFAPSASEAIAKCLALHGRPASSALPPPPY
jgi:hypothetical protein